MSTEPEYFDEDGAIAKLLADGILFCNSRDYGEKGQVLGHTIVLFVICNDLFSWGCADAEDLPFEEVKTLYNMHIADPVWGVSKWCCRRRNEKPQRPVADQMKQHGVWDTEMESMQDNGYDAILMKERKQ